MMYGFLVQYLGWLHTRISISALVGPTMAVAL